MRIKSCLLLIFALWAIAHNLNGQIKNAVSAIHFYNDLEQATQLAKKQNKNVFVFSYTTWSMPSTNMVASVFTDSEVEEFISKRFIAVKLDADREGRKFSRKFDVYGFPTLLFLDADGEEMHRVIGFANKSRLLRAGDLSFRNPKQQLDKFKENYKKNKNDPLYLKDYVAFAEEIEDYDLADKMADQYAKNINKARKVDWMDFVMRYVYKEKSKLFDLLKQNIDDFKKLYGEETVNKVLVEIIINSELEKMPNPDTKKFITKIKKRINKYNFKVPDEDLLPSIATRVFNVEIPFENDIARTQLAVRILTDYSEQMEPQFLKPMIATVAVNRSEELTLQIAKKQTDKLISVKPSTSLHDLHSILLYKLGDKEGAYKEVALAQELAIKSGTPYKSSLREMKKVGLVE